MIFSKEHRFVFLLPWKTASSTAYARLQPYNDSPYERFYDYNPYLLRVVHQHLCYSDYLRLPESLLNFRTGAFVRNPYDRVYSAFVQMQRDIQTQPHQQFAKAWVKELVMKQLSENFSQLAAANFDFNTWFLSVKDYQIYEIGRNSSFPLHPAHYWTGSYGHRKVDFIGKVETFEDDFDAFCVSVGVTVGERVNENITTPSQPANNTERPRYLERMTTETIEKINTLFNADFDQFDYIRFHTSE